MARNRFTVDELLEQLRSQGYSDLGAVKYAVLETSGQVSVLPYTKASPVTPQVMNLEVKDDVTLPILLINDGHVMSSLGSSSPICRFPMRRRPTMRIKYKMMVRKNAVVIVPHPFQVSICRRDGVYAPRGLPDENHRGFIGAAADENGSSKAPFFKISRLVLFVT